MQICYWLTTIVSVVKKEADFLDVGKIWNEKYILIISFACKFSQGLCLVENCIQNFNFKQ